jgi:hypothetical protein
MAQRSSSWNGKASQIGPGNGFDIGLERSCAKEGNFTRSIICKKYILHWPSGNWRWVEKPIEKSFIQAVKAHGRADHRVLNPNGLQRGPGPRKPGLAPCDLYLFGSLKGSLQRSSCDAGQHLVNAIDAVFQTMQTVNREDVLPNEGERSGDDAKAGGVPEKKK